MWQGEGVAEGGKMHCERKKELEQKVKTKPEKEI
jgi:hypothetical protein